MLTQVQRWGNSLGLRIPRSFAEETRIKKGSKVDLTVVDGRLIITPLRPKRYTLEALVAKIKPSNLHPNVETGNRRGREIW